MDYEKLNRTYRDDGWGLVTDKCLGCEPHNVESVARCVARWAYEQIRFRDLLIADLVDHEGAEGFSESTREVLKQWKPLKEEDDHGEKLPIGIDASGSIVT